MLETILQASSDDVHGEPSLEPVGPDHRAAKVPSNPSMIALTHLGVVAELLAEIQGAQLGRAIAMLLKARAAGRRVYVMGNGGSAATASHFVCDLMKTAHSDGLSPLRAFALTDNTPLFSAWANDTAYERAFAEQVHALVEPADVVIGISASGNSPNIIAGLIAARARSALTIGLLGFDGGAALDLVDIPLHIHSHDYGVVEDVHSAITHAITAAIREALRQPVTGIGTAPEFGGRTNGHARLH